jgi:hypothetical protein
MQLCRGAGSNCRHVDFPIFFLALPQGSDYIIIPNKSGAGRCCGFIVGSHPLVSTPAFAKVFVLKLSGKGLARDYPFGLPRIHPVFSPRITTRGTENSVHCSTTELPRRCGPERIRTPYLLGANEALYQVSYWPL